VIRNLASLSSIVVNKRDGGDCQFQFRIKLSNAGSRATAVPRQENFAAEEIRTGNAARKHRINNQLWNSSSPASQAQRIF
jgi:hypothetical protein